MLLKAVENLEMSQFSGRAKSCLAQATEMDAALCGKRVLIPSSSSEL